MKLQFFFSTDLATILSNSIIIAEGGFWNWRKARKGKLDAFSHTGALFTGTPDELEVEPDADGISREYYESIHKRDERTGKTGVRGPYPFAKLAQWQSESPGGRRLAIVNCPGLYPPEILAARAGCRAAVPEIKYAHCQLAQNARAMYFRKGIGIDKRSPLKWTCVEMNMRILPPRIAVEVFGLGDHLYDEYAPWAIDRAPGFYQLLLSHCDKMRDVGYAWNQRYSERVSR